MNDKKIIVENALYILGLKDSNIDEATRRYTYRARSPGVKPTTGIKLILPKTSSMGQKIQKVLDGDDPKKLKQMNNLVIGREDDGKEISLEFKTAASREKFRKMMNESVELDEMKKSDGPFTVVALKGKKVVGQLRNVEHYDIEVAIDMMRKKHQGAKISVESKKGRIVHTESVQLDETVKLMFKGFGKEVTEFQQKLKKFGQAADYRIMMQNFKNHSNVGDGLYFTDTSKGLGFEIHSVRDRMMGDKIRKLGDSQDLGGGKTVTLIAIKEDVQLGEEVIKARVAFFGRPNQNNSDMRDAKKKNMFVDAKDVSAAKGKMFDVTFNSRRQFNRFESEYDFLMVKVFEDVQIDEEVAARDPQKMVKGLSKKAKQEVADQLNKMNLSGYGDYKATATNVHKFRPKDLMAAMKKVMRLDELRKIPDAFERTRKIKNVFKDSDIKRLSKSVGNEAYDGGFRGDKEDLPGSVKDMVRNIHAYSDNDLIIILLADIPHASGQARMALQGRGHKVNSPARRKSDIKLRKS